MGYITSGNQMVDDMSMLNISGNIVPQMWYSTITRDNGKPYLLAITLLSDIVYWYRPSEERDERTGNVIGLKKKIKGDLLQKTYQQYADMYGESKRSIKAAFDGLENLGVINRCFRDVTCENGVVLQNIMFLKLNVEVLKILTYPAEQSMSKDLTEGEYIAKETVFEKYEDVLHRVVQNSVGGGTKFCRGYDETLQGVVQNSVRDGTKFCRGYDEALQEVVQNSVGDTTKFCGTNTKNITESTTQNTYIDYINPISLHDEILKIDGEDQVAYYQKLVRKNVDYDLLKKEMGYRSDELDEILKIMVDVLVGEGEVVRVNGAYFPYAEVKKRLLEIDCDHIRYIVDCLRKNHSSIVNIRAYLLTALFNAPTTINNYYATAVNSDLIGRV